MFMKPEKGRHKRNLIAVFLVMTLIFTVAMPINAMSESQGDENTSELETRQEDVSEQNNQDLLSVTGKSEDNLNNDIQESEQREKLLESENSEDETENEATEQTVMMTSTSGLDEAADWVGNINKANEWQIVSEEYAGREQTNKKGYDIDKDGSDDIYYQKNVIPTGVENEFRVYLGITKSMTWDELIAESNFAITTANSWHNTAIGTRANSINGNYSTIYPGKATSGGNNYEAVVNYTRNGKIVHTYKGWYHGTTPNCANGTGFIQLIQRA